MLFGPMKPVGLEDPKTGKRPYAVIQLRQDNAVASLYNIVGFQTHLKWGEQKRVFQMIPGLENAEIVRYGVMHRNSFLNSPKVLRADLSLQSDPQVFFAGQLTGVEGYMESAACGLLAAHQILRRLAGKAPLVLPQQTMCGALAHHLAAPNADFQPMGSNMGLLPPLEQPVRDKRLRYEQLALRAVEALRQALQQQAAQTM